MYRNILLVLSVFLSASCFAGVDTILHFSEIENCKIEVSHSATPKSKTGTILFSSYKTINGINMTCNIGKKAVIKSLSHALSVLATKENLANVTSVRIGHIQYYKWVKAYLESKANSTTRERIGYKKFNELIVTDVISKPFQVALQNSDFKLNSASCEKRVYYSNGAPEDGFCWLVIGR